MKKFIFLFILFFVVVVGIWGASPYYTLYNLKKAYDSQNTSQLVSSINYPALQTNINTQLSSRLHNTVNDVPLLATFGGDTIKQTGDLLINESVQGAITPENLTTLLTTQNQVNNATKQLAAIWAVVSDKVAFGHLAKDLLLQGGDIKAALNNQVTLIENKLAQTQAQQTNNEPSYSYCGINCFEVTAHVQGFPITITLKRENYIEWQVVGMNLP